MRRKSSLKISMRATERPTPGPFFFLFLLLRSLRPKEKRRQLTTRQSIIVSLSLSLSLSLSFSLCVCVCVRAHEMKPSSLLSLVVVCVYFWSIASLVRFLTTLKHHNDAAQSTWLGSTLRNTPLRVGWGGGVHYRPQSSREEKLFFPLLTL